MEIDLVVKSISDDVSSDVWVVDKTSQPLANCVKDIKVRADWDD